MLNSDSPGAHLRTADGRRTLAVRKRALCALALAGGVAFLGSRAAHAAGEHMSFLNPQGVISEEQMHHWWLVVAILLIFVALPVFVGTLLIAFRYRYRAAKAAGRKYSPHWNFFLPQEYINWGGPIVIVIIMGILVWQNTERFDPYRAIASDAATTQVQVVGYDWKWLFIYPKEGIASVGMLAFPAEQPLAMDLTTAGNMQSMWIPALGSQIYAMAGMRTQLNYEAFKPGEYLGMNTMYNGDGFHEQKFNAVSMKPADFQTWVAEAKRRGVPLDAKAAAALMQRAGKAELRQALPEAVAPDGNIYFTDVKPEFFHAVIQSMLQDTALPTNALAAPVAVTEEK